jgi:hypothetical protein
LNVDAGRSLLEKDLESDVVLVDAEGERNPAALLSYIEKARLKEGCWLDVAIGAGEDVDALEAVLSGDDVALRTASFAASLLAEPDDDDSRDEDEESRPIDGVVVAGAASIRVSSDSTVADEGATVDLMSYML